VCVCYLSCSKYHLHVPIENPVIPLNQKQKIDIYYLDEDTIILCRAQPLRPYKRFLALL
jgi:hypothetical protein